MLLDNGAERGFGSSTFAMYNGAFVIHSIYQICLIHAGDCFAHVSVLLHIYMGFSFTFLKT